jgi:hypothetical protein
VPHYNPVRGNTKRDLPMPIGSKPLVQCGRMWVCLTSHPCSSLLTIVRAAGKKEWLVDRFTGRHTTALASKLIISQACVDR